MTRVCFYVCFLMFSTFVYGQDKQISTKTELKRLYEIQQLPAYVDGSHVSARNLRMILQEEMMMALVAGIRLSV